MTRRLRAGDWVEVRGSDEILATLDSDSSLDGLPFMPEMLAHCGRRYQVGKRADKTCDTITPARSLRMESAVHLEDLRCDGAAHGGCQAQCLLFWKEAWLKRVDGPAGPGAEADSDESAARSERLVTRTPDVIDEGTQAPEDDGIERFRCQATELQRATTPIAWWEPGQYWRDISSGNVGLGLFVTTIARAAFNFIQRKRGGLPRPSVLPSFRGEKTPVRRLDLQPGELVKIRSKEEIEATLDGRQKNRGLYFDVEMLPFCGKTARVKARIERIVDEKTGRMLRFSSDCIMLEGVVCGGCLSHDRLFCPRAIYPYWREIWLERVDAREDGEARTGQAGDGVAAELPPRPDGGITP